MRRAFAHGIVWLSLFTAAMALHAASLSRGGKNGLLNGSYGFAVHGTVESGTVQERNFVMSGIIEFDGQGGVTNFEATATVDEKVLTMSDEFPLEMKYQVNGNGSGKIEMSFAGGSAGLTRFDFAIAVTDKGDAFFLTSIRAALLGEEFSMQQATLEGSARKQ